MEPITRVMTVARDMRVLVLDDEAHRHEWFARQATELGWSVVHVWSAEEAIQTLKGEPRFHVVFLDFDLAVLTDDHQRRDNTWVTGPNGAVAARFLAHVLPMGKRPGHVHIHSWNPPGADEMEALLKVAGLKVSRQEFGAFSFVARGREEEKLASGTRLPPSTAADTVRSRAPSGAASDSGPEKARGSPRAQPGIGLATSPH